MGTLLDRLGIAVRTGHHCAQPLMLRMGIEGTVRASFGCLLYTSVFAINKVDKPHANPDKIKEELAAMNFLVDVYKRQIQ